MSHARRVLLTHWHFEAGCQVWYSLAFLLPQSCRCQGALLWGGRGIQRRGDVTTSVFRSTCSSIFLPCLWLSTLQALYQTCEKSTELSLTPPRPSSVLRANTSLRGKTAKGEGLPVAGLLGELILPTHKNGFAMTFSYVYVLCFDHIHPHHPLLLPIRSPLYFQLDRFLCPQTLEYNKTFAVGVGRVLLLPRRRWGGGCFSHSLLRWF